MKLSTTNIDGVRYVRVRSLEQEIIAARSVVDEAEKLAEERPAWVTPRVRELLDRFGASVSRLEEALGTRDWRVETLLHSVTPDASGWTWHCQSRHMTYPYALAAYDRSPRGNGAVRLVHKDTLILQSVSDEGASLIREHDLGFSGAVPPLQLHTYGVWRLGLDGLWVPGGSSPAPDSHVYDNYAEACTRARALNARVVDSSGRVMVSYHPNGEAHVPA